MINFLHRLFGTPGTADNIKFLQREISYTEKELEDLRQELRYYQKLELKNQTNAYTSRNNSLQAISTGNAGQDK